MLLAHPLRSRGWLRPGGGCDSRPKNALTFCCSAYSNATVRITVTVSPEALVSVVNVDDPTQIYTHEMIDRLREAHAKTHVGASDAPPTRHRRDRQKRQKFNKSEHNKLSRRSLDRLKCRT